MIKLVLLIAQYLDYISSHINVHFYVSSTTKTSSKLDLELLGSIISYVWAISIISLKESSPNCWFIYLNVFGLGSGHLYELLSFSNYFNIYVV
jgi:hypothetical protein